jgi:hypothetical protein
MSQTIASARVVKQWVLDPPSAIVDIRLPKQEDDEPAVGKGFELELGKFWLNPDTKENECTASNSPVGCR